jgi:transposase
MYLIASTRCGISAKQLERELGVTYKCAWRIFNKIRNVAMADVYGPLRGDVEVDEASVDGKPKRKQGERIATPQTRSEAAKLRERSRATVFAAVERGGRIKATVLPSRRGPQLKKQVIDWVEPESIVITDEWPAYNGLDRHFIDHSRINHSAVAAGLSQRVRVAQERAARARVDVRPSAAARR